MDTRRLILVLIFTFSSFMLWESWQKYNQPKPPANAATTAPAKAGGRGRVPAATATTSAASAHTRATGEPTAASAVTPAIQVQAHGRARAAAAVTPAAKPAHQIRSTAGLAVGWAPLPAPASAARTMTVTSAAGDVTTVRAAPAGLGAVVVEVMVG